MDVIDRSVLPRNSIEKQKDAAACFVCAEQKSEVCTLEKYSTNTSEWRRSAAHLSIGLWLRPSQTVAKNLHTLQTVLFFSDFVIFLQVEVIPRWLPAHKHGKNTDAI